MNYLLFLVSIIFWGIQGNEMPEVASIIIDKPAHTLYGLTAESDTLVRFDCALGRNYGQKMRVGDCKTPEGDFKIVSIEDSREWDGDASGSDYGPWFMRLGGNTQWTHIGIHGTNQPATVGTRASLGCIRLHNTDLALLHRLVKRGCDVRILPDEITTNNTFPSTVKASKTLVKDKKKASGASRYTKRWKSAKKGTNHRSLRSRRRR